MSSAPASERPVSGRVDADGRLVQADPPLADLNRRAGGEGDMLSLPQIAALARLARRLGITISRAAIAADGDHDLDLWVRAEPVGDEVALSITGWSERSAEGTGAAAPAERERDFLRSGADWTWETDETLRLTALSATAVPAVGRSPSELIGGQMTRLFRFRESEDGSLPILTALAEREGFEGQVAELRTGRSGQFRLSAVPLIDGMGRFAGFRGAAVSLSAEGEAAAAAEAGAAPAFGARLERALRAPLDRIVANAERLRAEPGEALQPNYAEYAADIASAGRHLLSLVEDLVDLQAIERPDFAVAAEPIDLCDLARRAAGLIAVGAAERDVKINVPAATESLPVAGEATRTLQILMNLIGNAIRYSPDGSQVWVRCERDGVRAAVVVADQGKGIAQADQERIFGKFERLDPAEPGGSGLGLYIARRLARAMNGDILVDSAPGQGSRFTFTLPIRIGE